MSKHTKTTVGTGLAVLVVTLAAAGLLLHADVPQVPSNSWVAAGSMTSVRAGASATLLPNGYVLVAGGVDAAGPTASAERFSPDGATFLDASSMQLPRANHTATLLADGRVLVAGGTSASGAADATAEIYDPSGNVWLPAGSLNVARRGHTATRLPDGKVLVAGGDDNGVAIDSLEVFDPATALFTVVADASSGARTLHAAAALLDGRVLIAGGFDGTNPLTSTSVYDPETHTASAGPDLSTARSGLTATTLLDGRVLVAGGAGSGGELASAEIFDPTTNAFTPTDNALSSARQNHLAFLLPHNNQVLIVGGLADNNPVAAAEYFTPWEGTNGVFCAQTVCASGYVGPTPPGTARAWATGSALSFPAGKTIRTGPADGLLVLAGGSGQQTSELFGFATVKTDKEDYAPGTTVTITGGGWKPHEFVALVLRESPTFDEHPLLDVEADDNGNIISEEFVPDEHDIGIRFYLTAYGEESQAQTTFRDGKVNQVTVAAPTSVNVTAGNTAGYGDVSVSFNGTFNASNPSCAATLGVTPPLPNGASAVFGTNPVTGTDNPGTQISTLNVTTTATGLNATPPGTYTFSVTATDGAGCQDTNTSNSNTLTLIVSSSANVAPIADNKTTTTNEDTSVGITLSGSDAGTCNLTFSIVASPSHGSLGSIANNACSPGSPNTDSATVQYTPSADYNGPDSFTYKVNDGSLDSAAATVSIAVNAVNDPPSFTKGADQTVLEDGGAQTVGGWATSISKGPANEGGQTVNFIVSNNNNALFSAQPAVAANGTLTYTPAANANGSATVSVQIHDDGGTANGGSDTSAIQTFTISVTPVNDAPSFTKGADQTVLEDSGAHTVNPWATAISAGPNESGQIVDFVIDSNTNTALFSAQPVVSPSGVLTFTSAPNANGTATITLHIHDDGGSANSGVDSSATTSFTITVSDVNDAPSFTKGPDVTVFEDSGAATLAGWATGISAGPNESQSVDFVIDTNSHPALFSVPPSVSPAGTLTFTPAANANGSATITLHLHDDGGTANSGVNVSSSQSFVISVTAVNDAPSFTKGADQTVLEDSGAHTVNGWATSITAGPADESGQALDFVVTNDNNSLFSVQPALDSGGKLTYTTAPDAFGSATVSVSLHDNGGTANGGADTSAVQTLTIAVTSVNDAPSFVKGPDETVFEDAGAQTYAAWATTLSPGPANESGQTLNFIVSNNNNGLFSDQPAIGATGTLTFTTVANANGSALVTVQVHDDGGVANGGTDTSAAQTFVITVTPVNDAPSFTKGVDQTVLEDAGAQTSVNWATAISAGPSDEVGQALDFVVSNDNNSLFSVQPTISVAGALTYTLAANAYGTATVTVRLHDDGGTANGGADTSSPQTFVINVTPVNDPPSFLKGPDRSLLEDAGAQVATGWATAISPGPNENTQTVNFIVSNNNNALFSVQPSVATNGTLTFTPAPNANGFATVMVQAHDDGGSANGGIDTSAIQTFTITVTPVNDAPSFAKGDDQTVAEDSGPQTVSPWATAISAGPSDESGQSVDFVIDGNTNTALFSAQPTVSPAGQLIYTPAANANGSATISLHIHDNGGVANGGQDTSGTQTFIITVLAVNDAPSFTKGPDQTTLEDSGAQFVPGWASAISAGPADEAGQALDFVIDSNTNTALFSAQPAVSPSGALTYTPAPNANGSATITLHIHDNGGIANGGVDSSASQSFTINVTAVNDAPSFAKGADQTVAEDSGPQTVSPWATAISAGPVDEAGQSVNFAIDSNSNASLFATQPAVSSDGKLTYTPAPNANGSAIIVLHLHDSGGMLNGGVDNSATQSFTITVNAVNDAPAFTKGADQTALEDSGPHSVAGWASAISAGPPDESGQALNFIVSNNNNGIFSSQPTVASDGTLTYTPATNANGSAIVTVQIHDDGGTASGGVDTSASQTFTITVTAVNDAPSFTKGPDNTVLEDAGAQSVAGWATAISAGPADESGQALNFIVSNNNNGLFSVQPTVTANGTLTFTPAANANGSAVVTVQLHDNGGTANGGVDTSASQMFTINVTAVNDAPGFTKGANQTLVVNAGAQTVAGWATAISPGSSDEAGQALNFIVSNDNNALFSVQPAVAANGTLTFTPASNAVGTATVTARLHDNGGTDNGGADTSAPQTFTITVLYSTGPCLGEAGHQILQPINADGTSVSKKNSTVPAKFRVCDATGHSIGTPGVVTDFKIVQVINGTVTQNVNETPDSTTPDTAFRWSSSDQLWIYNVNTKDSYFMTNRTYVFNIKLADGSTIAFQFGLR